MWAPGASCDGEPVHRIDPRPASAGRGFFVFAWGGRSGGIHGRPSPFGRAGVRFWCIFRSAWRLGRRRVWARRVAAQAGFISAQEPPLCGGWPRNAPAGAVLALRANSPSRAPRKKRLPPGRGKLSSEARLMRVPTGVMLLTFSPSSGPAGHLPPCGGKALRAATWGRPYIDNRRGGRTMCAPTTAGTPKILHSQFSIINF